MTTYVDGFRPLSGSYISQLNNQSPQKSLQRFPSPIGELHFSIIMKLRVIWQMTVSVPYRGATFLNLIEDLRRYFKVSFRPLSGSYISQ